MNDYNKLNSIPKTSIGEEHELLDSIFDSLERIIIYQNTLLDLLKAGAVIDDCFLEELSSMLLLLINKINFALKIILTSHMET